MMRCFECDSTPTLNHHVVPASKGGTKTVPLCAECHAKVHDIRAVSTPELTRRALRRMKEDGKLTGSPPYGYRSDSNGNLVEDDYEMKVVREVIEMAECNISQRMIYAELNALGYRNRQGKKFTKTTIARIISTRL